MQFSRDNPSALSIRRVDRGAIRIGQETYSDNVLIFRNEVRRDVAVRDVSTLGAEDIEQLLAQGPEILILGTGWQAQQPPRELTFAMARRGIGFESMDTPAACRTFNILLSEGRDVAALLVIKE